MPIGNTENALWKREAKSNSTSGWLMWRLKCFLNLIANTRYFSHCALSLIVPHLSPTHWLNLDENLYVRRMLFNHVRSRHPVVNPESVTDADHKKCDFWVWLQFGTARPHQKAVVCSRPRVKPPGRLVGQPCSQRRADDAYFANTDCLLISLHDKSVMT